MAHAVKYLAPFLLLIGACKPAPHNEPPHLQTGELNGIVYYHGHLKNKQLYDWCHKPLKTDQLSTENEILPGALITLSGTQLAATADTLPPSITGTIIPKLGNVELGRCKIEPNLLVVSRGGTITVTNNDPAAAHTLYLLYQKAIVSQVTLDPTAQRSFTVQNSGFYQLGELRNKQWLYSTIFSTDDIIYTHSDQNGRYSFGELPAGDYQLHVRHPVLGEIDHTITISTGDNLLIHNNY